MQVIGTWNCSSSCLNASNTRTDDRMAGKGRGADTNARRNKRLFRGSYRPDKRRPGKRNPDKHRQAALRHKAAARPRMEPREPHIRSKGMAKRHRGAGKRDQCSLRRPLLPHAPARGLAPPRRRPEPTGRVQFSGTSFCTSLLLLIPEGREKLRNRRWETGVEVAVNSRKQKNTNALQSPCDQTAHGSSLCSWYP